MLEEQRQRIRALAESPITGINYIGDFSKEGAFGDIDRKILTHPIAVEKLKTRWENTEFEFDLYFLNRLAPGIRRWRGYTDAEDVRHHLGLTPEELPDPNPDHITAIFTQNNSIDFVPMTPWMIAHRLAHAMSTPGGPTDRAWNEFDDAVSRALSNAYEDKHGIPPDSDELLDFAQTVLTMKSARTKAIRDWGELVPEVFAQYLLAGEVQSNGDDLYTRDIERAINYMLHIAKGEIFVQ